MKLDHIGGAYFLAGGAFVLALVAVVLSVIALLGRPDPRWADEEAARAEAARNGNPNVRLPLRPLPVPPEKIRRLQPATEQNAAPADGQ